MTWLLDTNIVSELGKPEPDAHLVVWLEAHAEDCALSVITLAELRWGIERLTEGRRKAERERDFGYMVEDYRGTLL